MNGLCVAAHQRGGPEGGDAFTDSEGRYTIGGLPDGNYTVGFHSCHGSTQYGPDYFPGKRDASSATPVAVSGGRITHDVDGRLESSPAPAPAADSGGPRAHASIASTGSITGTVLDDATGLPLQGICTYAAGSGFSYCTTTGANGGYQISGLAAGTYKVQFYDYANNVYLSEFYDNAPDYSSATPVTVTAGIITSGINARLAVAGKISGTVVGDDGGAPLSNICVSASSNTTYRSAYTSVTGTYLISGLAGGKYHVYFSDCGTGSHVGEYYDNSPDYSFSTPVTVTAGSTTSGINAGLAAAGKIRGTVVADDGGAPLSNICVNASANNAYGSATTSVTGTYVIGGLPTGSFRVNFYDCGSGNHLGEYYNNATDYSSATPVSVTAGTATSGIDAGLAPAAKIAGTVIADQGAAPLSNICVYANGTNGYGNATTSVTGTYVIGQLSPGSYNVRFYDCSGRGYAAEYYDNTSDYVLATPVRVTTGSTRSGVNAGLALAGKISGTVIADDGGAPLSGICVNASSNNGGYGYGTTGVTGTYLIEGEGMAPGSYVVSFNDCSGSNHLGEYYNNTRNRAAATPVTVAAGTTTPGVNAGLAPGPTVPSAPSGVAVTVTGSTSANVSFTAPASDGGSPITSYGARCVSSNGGTTQLASAAASPVAVSGLTTGSTYTCQVRAINSIGAGPYSTASPSFVSGTLPTVPGAPSGVVVRITSATSVSVSFAAPASNGGSAITSYQAKCVSSNGGTTQSGSGGVSPVAVSGLTTGSTYKCRVRAINAVGAGSYSPASATFVPA